MDRLSLTALFVGFIFLIIFIFIIPFQGIVLVVIELLFGSCFGNIGSACILTLHLFDGSLFIGGFLDRQPQS